MSPMIRRGAWLVLACALLSWPALYNGQALFSTDTSAYVRGVDAGVESLTHIGTAWSHPPGLQAPEALPGSASGAAPAAEPTLAERTVLAGRSVYYGALLYLGYLLGNFWFVVFLQALVVALLLGRVLAACGLERERHQTWVLATVALTTAPLFISFLSPDLFAAVTILTVALLQMPGTAKGRMRLALGAVLLASLLFHTSHVALTVALLLGGIALAMLRRELVDRRGLMLVGAAVLLAVAGEAMFNMGVTRVIGQSPVRPPFLMARVIDDGPGLRYLQATCPASGFVVCRFVGQLPVGANAFLWSEDPAVGVFSASDPQTRRLLSEEQGRFALAALRFEPGFQIMAALRNGGRQLLMIGVPSFNYSAADSASILSKAPPGVATSLRASAAYHQQMPTAALSFLSRAGAILSALAIVTAMALPRTRVLLAGSPLLLLAGYVLAGVVINAFICGALAVPFDRYQARVVWLLPLLAVMTVLHLHRMKHAGRANAPDFNR